MTSQTIKVPDVMKLDPPHQKNAFLKQLKESTWAQHQALERTELSRRLMSPTLRREEYVHILYAFYGGFQPLEVLLAKVLPHTVFNLEPRADLALEDIAELSGTFLSTPPLPLMPWEQASVSVPEAIGILYVLEGSRLGGKAISKQLAKSLGVTASKGGTFFAESGVESWRDFQEKCESYVAQQPAAGADIIQAANATFHSLHRYFTQYYSLYFREC